MITLEEIEKRYNYTFPPLYRKLWNEDMLNWMRGFESPLTDDLNWANDVYPTLTERPPLLLHSGGPDFELMTPEQMMTFEYPQSWDTDTHHFIPFSRTSEGEYYAFYKNIETSGENPVVLIWDDMNETEIVAKNFEDFIFRKMLEASYDVDKEDLEADYGKEKRMEHYREDLLKDLQSIRPYLNEQYVTILENIYNAEIIETLISYHLKGQKPIGEIIEEMLYFEQMSESFEHER